MKKAITFLMAAAVFAACSKTVEGPSGNGIPMEVGVFSGIPTKAPITGTTMPTSRHIVFSTYYNAAEGSSANYFTGIDFSYKGEGTIWTTGKYWPLSGTLDFLGYSLDNLTRVSSVAWGSNVASTVTMTLADNNSNQDDLLVGGASALTAASNAVVMKHAQALLTCRAKSNVAYNAGTNYGITITDIKFNSTKHSGTVLCTRTGGNIAFTWSSLGSSMNKSLPSMTSTNLTTTFANINGTPGLMVPSQTETSITIYYTIHNGFASDGVSPVNNNLQYTWTPGSPITWQPGKRYTYDIDMSLTQITVSASVTDWVNNANTPVNIP